MENWEAPSIYRKVRVPYRKNGIPLGNCIIVIGAENKNFCSNYAEATQEEKGGSKLQLHVWISMCCSYQTGNVI